MTDLLAPRLSSLDILREFSTRFTDRTKVALTTLSLTRLDEPDKAKITFNVEANSHQNISQLVSVMKQSGLFREIKQGQVTAAERSKRSIFQVQISCNLASNAIQMFTEIRYINPTLVNSSTATVGDSEDASGQYRQNRGEEWRRNSENREWENGDEDEDVETSKNSSESKVTEEKKSEREFDEKSEREFDEDKSSQYSEKRDSGKSSDRDNYAKQILPSKEEYDRMSPREQQEVRATKGAIYGKDEDGEDRDGGSDKGE